MAKNEKYFTLTMYVSFLLFLFLLIICPIEDYSQVNLLICKENRFVRMY